MKISISFIPFFKFPLLEDRTSILLTVAALILGFYSITQSKFTIGPFGFIDSLPITFFLSLVILLAASSILWISPRPHDRLLFLQTCLLIVFLFLTPLLVAGPNSYPSDDHSYRFWGNADHIIRKGHVDNVVNWYHNWPATYILLATSFEVLGISSPDLLITIMFPLWQLVSLPFLFIIFSHIIGEEYRNHRWAAIWFYYVGCWTGRWYLGAHSFGFFLVLASFTLLFRKSALNRRRLITCLPIFATLAFTHALTSLILLSILGALCAIRKVKWYAFLFMAISIVAWSFYGALPYFQVSLAKKIEQLLRLDLLWSEALPGRLSAGTEAHMLVNRIKILTTVISSAVAFAGFMLSRKLQKGSNAKDKDVLASIVGLIIFVILIGVSYSHELPERTYFVVLPFFAYFGVKLLRWKSSALLFCIVLSISAPLLFISLYGNMYSEYVPPGQITATHFFHEYAVSGTVIGGWPLGVYRDRERYYSMLMDGTTVHNAWVGNLSCGTMPGTAENPWNFPTVLGWKSIYISMSSQNHNVYAYGYGMVEFYEETWARLDTTTVTFNLVYINPDLSLYAYNQPVYGIRCYYVR